MAKERESGAELLRIVAMLLVVLVHVNFWSLGAPTKTEIDTTPLVAVSRYFFEAVGIVCVNCFVFVSGWFGIKPKLNRILSVIFQIFFHYSVVLLVALLLRIEDFSWGLVLQQYNFLNRWFIVSYLALFIVSPIFNSFIENGEKRQSAIVIISFVLLDVFLGWGKDYLHFIGGYSLLHFIVIYLIARYLGHYGIKELMKSMKPYVLLLIYGVSVLLITGLTFGTYYVHERLWGYMGKLFLYNSPLVIIASIAFSLYFISLKFKNSLINTIAGTSFAVYLIHANQIFSYNHMRSLINGWFQSYDFSVFCLYAFLFILSLFFCAFVLDKIRQMLWEKISRYIR